MYLRLNGEFTGWLVETKRWAYLKISLFLSEYLEVSGDAEASGHLVLLTASVIRTYNAFFKHLHWTRRILYTFYTQLLEIGHSARVLHVHISDLQSNKRR